MNNGLEGPPDLKHFEILHEINILLKDPKTGVNFVHQIYGPFSVFMAMFSLSSVLQMVEATFNVNNPNKKKAEFLARQIYRQIYWILSCQQALNCTHCYCVALSLKPP